MAFSRSVLVVRKLQSYQLLELMFLARERAGMTQDLKLAYNLMKLNLK
jgi:hypothetical protein